MFLIRLLMFALVAWILWRIWRTLNGPRNAGRAVPPVDMVQCAHCALHLPRATAVHDHDWYCCEAHRAEHHARKQQH